MVAGNPVRRQRRFSVEEICSIFGVPPQMIGDQSKATFANVERAGLNFLTLAVLPWVTRFEAEVNRKLFRIIPGTRQPFVKLNTSAIVRANIEARNRAYALGRQWGWLSVNDIRRLEDIAPIGPEGDVYLQPMNMEDASNDPSSSGEETANRIAQLPPSNTDANSALRPPSASYVLKMPACHFCTLRSRN